MANPFDKAVNPFGIATNPFDIKIDANPFDAGFIEKQEDDPYSSFGLDKVESISAAPGLMGRLKTSMKRKLAIFQKAGLEGLTLDNVTLNDLPLWSGADKDTFEKQATEVEPHTTVEKLEHDIIKFGYSLIPMYISGKLVGWGKAGLTKGQMVTRAAGVGGILGAAEKPGEEAIEKHGELGARERAALKSAGIWGGITAAGMGIQHILSQYSKKTMKASLDKAMKTIASVEPEIKAMDTTKAWKMLQEITPHERHVVMNIMRGKWGMKQEVWKSWVEKNISEPAYIKFIDVLERVMPEKIKKAFIYRHAQPEEYVKLAEKRLKNIHLWQEKANMAGKLVTEDISEAESKAILRAIKEPTQMEILRRGTPTFGISETLANYGFAEYKPGFFNIKTGAFIPSGKWHDPSKLPKEWKTLMDYEYANIEKVLASGQKSATVVAGYKNALTNTISSADDVYKSLSGKFKELYGRAFAARQIIDEGSQQLANLKSLPEKTRETILENLGSYAKRVYKAPDTRKGLFKFFTGKRGIREPKLFEKGKVARKMYEKPLQHELKNISQELNYIDDISQIEGIGPMTKERLRRNGYGSIQKISKADPYVLDEIISGKKVDIRTEPIFDRVKLPSGVRIKDVSKAPYTVEGKVGKVKPSDVKSVVIADGKQVGRGILSVDTKTNTGWLFNFKIDKKFQRKGIGTELLNDILRNAKAKFPKLTKLSGEVESEAGYNLFKRFGAKFYNPFTGKEIKSYTNKLKDFGVADFKDFNIKGKMKPTTAMPTFKLDIIHGKRMDIKVKTIKARKYPKGVEAVSEELNTLLFDYPELRKWEAAYVDTISNKVIWHGSVHNDLFTQETGKFISKPPGRIKKIIGKLANKTIEGFDDIPLKPGFYNINTKKFLSPEQMQKTLDTKHIVAAHAGAEDPDSWSIISQADALNRYKSKLTGRSNEIKNLIVKPKIKPDIPKEVRMKLGEIETAGYPVARSIQDMGYKVETAGMFEEVASNTLLSTDDVIMAKQSGWTLMPDTPNMGSLAGKYVHPVVADDVNNITKIISTADRVYQELLSAWKMGKTTLNPATHGRNILSNTMLLEMSGVPAHRIPDLVSASYDDMIKQTPLYKDLKKAGLGLGTFKSAEIESLSGVYSGKSTVSDMLEAAGRKVDKTFLGDMNRLYQAEEELFKIAKARHLIEQGFTVENALAEGEKWLFNYSKIPSFINKVKSNPLGAPFITFQYKAMPRILEALIKRPLTILKYPVLLNAVEHYSITKLGLTEQQVRTIKKDKPLTFILPWTDSNGNIRVYDMQYTVPYGELFERRKVAGGEIPTFGLMQNPMYATSYNLLAFNKDPYTGRNIVSEDATETKKAKQRMGYIAQQLLPPLTPGIGYSAKTIAKAAEGRTDRYGVKSDYWWEIIGAIGGLKTKPKDMSVESYKLLVRTDALWRDYDIKQAGLLKDQSLTSGERQKQFREVEQERIRGFNKLWEGIIPDKDDAINPFDTNPFDKEKNPFD